MEQSTIIGVVLGLVAVVGGMVVKGASLTALINPAAFMIIILGTVACLFNAIPIDKIKQMPTMFKQLIRLQEMMTNQQLVP